MYEAAPRRDRYSDYVIERPRCGRWLPKPGEPCGRPENHNGPCRAESAVRQRVEYGSERRRLMVKDRREAIDQYKIQHGCVDCGFRKDPVALDFDHTNPASKVANVSALLRSAHWDAVLAELAKCLVRCANCHRIKTHRSPPPTEDDGLSA